MRFRIPIGRNGRKDAIAVHFHCWETQRSRSALVALYWLPEVWGMRTFGDGFSIKTDVSCLYIKVWAIYYPAWLLRRFGMA